MRHLYDTSWIPLVWLSLNNLIPLKPSFQKPLTFGFFHFLDRIPERCPGNLGVVLDQEGFYRGRVFLPGFAEHPADGLVHEVFAIGQKPFSQPESVIQLSFVDEVHGGDDGDAAFPQNVRNRQPVKDHHLLKTFVDGPPQDLVCRAIHQVPVVDVLHIMQVKVQNGLPWFGICARCTIRALPFIRRIIRGCS